MSPMEQVLLYYGAEKVPHRSGWAKMRCPFHEDQNPSASVNLERQRFKCYACNLSQALVGLIKWVEGVGYSEAIQIAQKITGRKDFSVGKEPASSRAVPKRSRDRFRNRSEIQAWRREGL